MLILNTFCFAILFKILLWDQIIYNIPQNICLKWTFICHWKILESNNICLADIYLYIQISEVKTINDDMLFVVSFFMCFFFTTISHIPEPHCMRLPQLHVRAGSAWWWAWNCTDSRLWSPDPRSPSGCFRTASHLQKTYMKYLNLNGKTG